MIDLADIHSVADVPRVQARLRPDAEAICFEGRSTTFGELDRASNQCAQALLAQGLKPGDRVGVLAKNIDDFFVLWFGCIKARVTLAPVNWRLAPPEIAFILKDAGAKLLVVGADFAGVVDMIIGGLPDIHGLVQFEPGHERWPAFRDWIGGHDAGDPGLTPDPQDDVIQLYTSGTTGLPKGVQLTQTNFLSLFTLALEAGWAKYEPGKTNLVVMPLFHVAGTNCGLLALLQGVRNILTREVNAGEIIARLQDKQVTYAFLAPTIINMLLQTAGVETADFSKLERIFYGASPISEAVLRQAQDRFGCSFTQLYGLTETIGGATYLPPEDHTPERDKLRSCGKPWPGFEVRVLTPTGEAGGPREVGEIQIRARGVMKGYWNRPDATAEAICPQGWFSSGDAGYFDDEGYLYIYDRVKDMIVSGGENVYPAEVENALFSHPAVADAAVIGVPDERWGEAVKGMVVLKPQGATGTGPGLVYFHGGGFVIGNLDTHDDFLRRLCKASGVRVLSVDYRLAPEHPFPAAHDDALAATKWAFDHAAEIGFDPARIAVGGDSAGGNLSACMALELRGDPAHQLAFQLLLYPATAMALDTPSRRALATGYVLTAEVMEWFGNHYGAGTHPQAKRAEPVHAESLAGLPPALVVTAGFDPLKDEGKAYAAALNTAGVKAQHVEYPSFVHDFYTLSAVCPGVVPAIEETAAALKAALG